MAYEERACRSCHGSGQVVEDASYDAKSGELVQEIGSCPTCQGSGAVVVYVYSSATSAGVRRMATERVMWPCWNGTARERLWAEKELARRDGSSR